MHIKVDEDLPAHVVQRLRDKDYDASSVLDQHLGGCKDPRLWRAGTAHGAVRYPSDKGFGIIPV